MRTNPQTPTMASQIRALTGRSPGSRPRYRPYRSQARHGQRRSAARGARPELRPPPTNRAGVDNATPNAHGARECRPCAAAFLVSVRRLRETCLRRDCRASAEPTDLPACPASLSCQLVLPACPASLSCQPGCGGFSISCLTLVRENRPVTDHKTACRATAAPVKHSAVSGRSTRPPGLAIRPGRPRTHRPAPATTFSGPLPARYGPSPRWRRRSECRALLLSFHGSSRVPAVQ